MEKKWLLAGAFAVPYFAPRQWDRVGDYRKLIVWQRASAVSDRIRAVVSRLPFDEQRRFADQACRAADSISLNIVDGCGLNAGRQLARHLTIALGSANELQDIVDAFERRGQLEPIDHDLPAEVRTIRAMLAGLHKRVTQSRGTPARKSG